MLIDLQRILYCILTTWVHCTKGLHLLMNHHSFFSRYSLHMYFYSEAFITCSVQGCMNCNGIAVQAFQHQWHSSACVLHQSITAVQQRLWIASPFVLSQDHSNCSVELHWNSSRPAEVIFPKWLSGKKMLLVHVVEMLNVATFRP